MSALTLVMKELSDMNEEEFVNVRAYHSRPKEQQLQFDGGCSSPICSEDSSGVSSLYSEEEASSNTASAANPRRPPKPKKEPKYNFFATEVNTALLKEENNDIKKNIKIMHEGRNILNLERNLHPYQWQLRSPLDNTYSFSKQNRRGSFRFVEQDGALVEVTVGCSECTFREPAQ